ncbi:DNA recombination protein RmuC [Trueperella pecoris]|uniref:DNA recombination protein RmuC n=1 Tax=Trueperella pecoris TaxID=2733571 RepID=A0A7M1R1M2_9ACTO|nr:DNA recombination protein RmuC [Trueperella pecoris]QOR47327.1 DNA recombination protein RmuC [Trueperella pecoris]
MTIAIPLFVLILALVATAAGAVGWALSSARANRSFVSASQEAMSWREQAAMAQARADRLVEENDGLRERSRADTNVLRALSPITQQLDQVTSHVQRLETKAASQHAEVVTQLRREAQIGAELSQNTASLNAALRTASARGRWGEVQLRRIVEAAGMLEHVDVDLQVGSARFARGAKDSTLRPDAIIHLPGDGHLAIDAKTPMDSYLLAMEIPAEDLASVSERAELLGKHAKAVRSHVSALIKRNYPADFPQSPQVTVMFLPSESLLAEATQTDPTLLEYALSNGVVLASPASLLAILRAIASVWSSAALTFEANEIVELGRTLVDRIGTVVSHLDKLGKSLGKSVNYYNAAVQSLETRLLVTVRSFSSLQPMAATQGETKLGPPASVAGDSAQIKEFRAPEFTQDQH